MKNFCICNMPTKTYENNKLPIFNSFAVNDVVSKILGIKKFDCINLIHSYRQTNYLDKFLTQARELNLNLGKDLWIDSDNIENLKKTIKQLIADKKIVPREENIYICECGIVEMVESAKNTRTPQNFYLDDGEPVCKQCLNKCKKVKRKILTLNFNEFYHGDIQVFPSLYKKDIELKINDLLNNVLEVSKSRATVVKVEVDNQSFYVDNDIVWLCWIMSFGYKNVIITTSSHSLYHVALSYLLFRDKINLYYIVLPYYKNMITDVCKDINLSRYKILTWYNLDFKKKETTYNNQIINAINAFTLEQYDKCLEKTYLYPDLVGGVKGETENLFEYLSRMLRFGTNYFYMKNYLDKQNA